MIQLSCNSARRLNLQRTHSTANWRFLNELAARDGENEGKEATPRAAHRVGALWHMPRSLSGSGGAWGYHEQQVNVGGRLVRQGHDASEKQREECERETQPLVNQTGNNNYHT